MGLTLSPFAPQKSVLLRSKRRQKMATDIEVRQVGRTIFSGKEEVAGKVHDTLNAVKSLEQIPSKVLVRFIHNTTSSDALPAPPDRP